MCVLGCSSIRPFAIVVLRQHFIVNLRIFQVPTLLTPSVPITLTLWLSGSTIIRPLRPRAGSLAHALLRVHRMKISVPSFRVLRRSSANIRRTPRRLLFELARLPDVLWVLLLVVWDCDTLAVLLRGRRWIAIIFQ